MDDHDENILPESLAKRRRKLRSVKQYHNKMLSRHTPKKNITSERKFEDANKNPGASCTNLKNDSLSSVGSVIENSDEENKRPVNNKSAELKSHTSIDISLKRTRSPSFEINTKISPVKVKKETKKIVILSNIKLTPKQSKSLSKNKVSSPHCFAKDEAINLAPNLTLLHNTECSSTVASELPAKLIISSSPDVSKETTASSTPNVSKPADFLDIPLSLNAHTSSIISPSSLHDDSIKPTTCVSKSPDPRLDAMSLSKPSSSIIIPSSPNISIDTSEANVFIPPLLDESASDMKTISEKFAANESPSLLVTEIDDSNQSLEKKKKKRRQVKKFKMSCIDFLSDEEPEDYSAGSSDYWTAKETESSSDEETDKRKRKQKRKKKTSNKEQSIEESIIESKKRVKRPNKQKERKNLRVQGKSYLTKSGNEMKEKSLKENPCVEGKCGRGCSKIPEDRRLTLFNFFWALELQRRRDWLVRCTRAVPVKRQKTKQDISRRQITYEYYLNEGEDHVQVCQQFILKTLDITQKFLLYTINNANEGMAQPEKRHSNAPVINESIKTFAKKYIEKLPAVPSHYCRKDSTCVYLPQEFKNLCNVYRLYCQECRSQEQTCLSEATFSKIFREEYKIRFHTPKKDKCSLCIAYENSMERTPAEIVNMKEHIDEKKASYRRFKLHQNLQDNKTITCSFDLQKVLNTPYGESMLLYYSRKYAVYNLTMYESGTQDVSCYVWGECDGKRGANEIATCLFKYLKQVDERGIKNVLLYCDSCSGQNKNKVVLAAINHFLHISKSVDVVQINYLLPGHTYMPVDSVHAVIENEVKKVIVWSPDQWPTFIESARKRPKPYNVNVFEHSDFISWDTITADTFTTISQKQIKMRNIRVATLKKKDLKKIEIKYSMKDDAQIHTISLFEKTIGKGKGRGKGKRGKNQPNTEQSQTSRKETFDLPQLYENRLCISKAKSNDLKRLCQKNVIPRRFHDLYMNLPTADDIKDVLPDTDEYESEAD